MFRSRMIYTVSWWSVRLDMHRRMPATSRNSPGTLYLLDCQSTPSSMWRRRPSRILLDDCLTASQAEGIYIHCLRNNVHLFIVWITPSKMCQFLVIFGIQKTEKIWVRLIDLPTLPVAVATLLYRYILALCFVMLLKSYHVTARSHFCMLWMDYVHMYNLLVGHHGGPSSL